ncbi:MAG: hypothetical protein AAF086_09610 [Planctomycetota bacterium]
MQDGKVTLELWDSPEHSNPTVIGAGQGVEYLKRTGALEADAQFINSFSAETYEQAMQQYYDYQGWGRYKPFNEENF